MMEKKTIYGVTACVFDAYGTLFDVHSAVGKYRQRLGNIADQVSLLWRTKQLEYTWLRSLMGHHADFWQVTGDALNFSFDMYRIDDPVLKRDLMEAYLRLDCYPEVPATLKTLKTRGMHCAILSNGTPTMLEAAVRHSGISDLLEATFSVEDVKIFKPDPRVYKMAVDRLHVPAEEIVFLSANAWDAAGASAFGFKVAWINRFGQSMERLPGQPDVEIDNLSELLNIIG
jgi:2-haloacid dehalogenase